MASTGFMEDAKNVLFKGFELFGTPDAYLRGLMAGSPGEKIWSGRDLLERTGWVGPERGGLDFGDIAGFAIDVMNPLSPTNLLFGWTKALGKGAMAGVKGLGGISKAAAAGKGAEALAQAKSLLGAAGGAAKAIAPGYAMAMGLPYAGAKLMAHGDERAPWKDALGMGLMTLPLALPLGMAAMRKGGFKKWSKKNVQEEIARLDAESGVSSQSLPQARAALQPARRELDFLEQMGIRAADEQQRVVQAARAQGIADLASDAGAQFVSGVAPPANPLSMRPGMTPQQELMERIRNALMVATQGQ